MAEKAEKKTEAQKLKEQLAMPRRTQANGSPTRSGRKPDLFCEGYKKFLDLAKTEREAVEITISMAREKGFKAFDPKVKYEAGDRVFLNNRRQGDYPVHCRDRTARKRRADCRRPY